jgi:hypothetical protein
MYGKLLIDKNRTKGILVTEKPEGIITMKILEKDDSERGLITATVLVHNLEFQLQNHIFTPANAAIGLTEEMPEPLDLLEEQVTGKKPETSEYGHLFLENNYYFLAEVQIPTRDEGYEVSFDFNAGTRIGEGLYSGVLFLTAVRGLPAETNHRKLVKSLTDGTPPKGVEIPKEEKNPLSKKERRQAKKLAKAKQREQARLKKEEAEKEAKKAIFQTKPSEDQAVIYRLPVREDVDNNEEIETGESKIEIVESKVIDKENMAQKKTRKERNALKFPLVPFEEYAETGYTWGQITQENKQVAIFETPTNTTTGEYVIFHNKQTAKFCLEYLKNNPSFRDMMEHAVPIPIRDFNSDSIKNTKGMLVKKGLSFVQSVFPSQRELQKEEETIDAT